MIPFATVVEMTPVFIAIVASGVLGFVVFLNNPKSITNRTLLLFSIAIILWNILNYLVSQPLPSFLAIWLLRLLVFFAIWLTFYLFQFFYVFPNEKISFPGWFTYGLFPLTLFTSILTLTPLVFSGITKFSDEGKVLTVTNGTGIPLFGVVVVGLILGSIFILLKDLYNAKGIRKTQLQFILLGTATTFCLYLIFNFILPAFFNHPEFIPFGAVFTLPFISVTVYVIVKHRFLDIRLVVARAIAYTLLLLILGVFYSTSIFLISRFLFTTSVNNTQVLIYAVLALFIATTSQPLKKLLEKVTNNIFFKSQYNTNDLLSNLTTIMATTIQLEHVSQETLYILLETMQISWGVFYIFKGQRIYKVITQNQHSSFPSASEAISLAHVKHLMIFEEEKIGKIKEQMRKLDAAVALPLSIGNTLHGILLLGNKKSGEMYSEQDIKVLEIFGPEMSVALENAASYEEIRQFNIRLHQEVTKATKDLKDANIHLQQLDRLKDEFVSLASHELRTPMTVIKNYLWMLLYDKKNKLNGPQKLYTQRAYESVDRLISLVNDMLNVSRIESGRLTVTFNKINIKELINDTVTEIQPQAAAQGINLYMESSNKKVKLLTMDSSRIKEVLINLIGNALKFTPKGGEIKVSLVPDEEKVTIQVTDSGKGIKAEDLPKLFKKFSIIGSDYLRKLNSQGTGLGLYLSKSIIELHGGKIWVESKGENQGATFSFTLPYEQPATSKIAQTAPAH